MIAMTLLRLKLLAKTNYDGKYRTRSEERSDEFIDKPVLYYFTRSEQQVHRKPDFYFNRLRSEFIANASWKLITIVNIVLLARRFAPRSASPILHVLLMRSQVTAHKEDRFPHPPDINANPNPDPAFVMNDISDSASDVVNVHGGNVRE